MGFQRKRKLYDLDFTETALEGLTMVMRGLSVSEYLELSALADLAKASTEKQVEEVRALFVRVANKIERWDLEDEDGRPIPPSVDELMSWDFDDAMATVDAWMAKVQGVSDPLEQKSNGGNKWVGPPIPMDIPSPNLPPS